MTSKPAGVIALALATTILRLAPLGLLVFVAMWGAASLGEGVPEYERFEPQFVAVTTAMATVGGVLLALQVFFAFSVKLHGLAVVAGLIALADVGWMLLVVLRGNDAVQAFLPVIGATLVVQLILVGITLKESRSRASTSDG